MEVSPQSATLAFLAGGTVIAAATYIATRLRERSKKDREEGRDEVRLTNVEKSVNLIWERDIPEIERRQESNTKAISELTVNMATLTANVTSLTGAVDRVQETAGQKTKLLSRALEKLLEDDES